MHADAIAIVSVNFVAIVAAAGALAARVSDLSKRIERLENLIMEKRHVTST